MSNIFLRVSTPGRVCLFGEHQDYLGLPVIPCAISVRIQIEGRTKAGDEAHIDLPDIGSAESLSLRAPSAYRNSRDYFRSSVNVLLRKGYTFSRGCDCTLRGTIPINSGTSSSSALIVTWLRFLAHISDQGAVPSPLEIARFAHEAEVLEFREPGGMMDHYSTSCGGVLAIDFTPEVRVQEIPVTLGSFVLGDSREPKDTTAILGRVKHGVLAVVKQLAEAYPDFSLHTADAGLIGRIGNGLTEDQRGLLLGTIRNREITSEARRMLAGPRVDDRRLGALLSEHQGVLRDVLRISTPKIDRMISASIDAGAYGGKINGSGGGGCMFAYAPVNPEKVAEAVRREGGIATIVSADAGSRTELLQESA
jgi:galactokinase